ncbi:MAG TPA: nucleotide exchange factor GrpE [Candidatus Methylacidiphilales bacterium]
MNHPRERRDHASPKKNGHPAAEDSAALQQELDAEKERHLRLAADFDNFRKRTNRESDRRAASQKEELMRELLPVIDNLERALVTGGTSIKQLHQGVEMTLQQLHRLLKQHGVEAEESLALPFDPNRHEAVAVRHDVSQPDQIVLETSQRGYRRGEEIFRPAKVVVNVLNPSEGHEHAG